MLLTVLAVLTGCGGGGSSSGDSGGSAAAPLAAGKANSAAAFVADTIDAYASLDTSGRLAGRAESRLLSIVYIAMYDAADAVDRRYQPYQSVLAVNASADVAAAVAAAARKALLATTTGQTARIESWYSSQIAALTAGPAVTAGIALGEQAAAGIIAARTGDGAESADVSLSTDAITNGIPPAAGAYIPTPTYYAPAAYSAWGAVKPFAVASVSDYMVPAPEYYTALDGDYFQREMAEVMCYGRLPSIGIPACDNATPPKVRTADQSELAQFWRESASQSWNRMAREIATARGLGGLEQLRLYALLNMAQADAFTAASLVKYTYKFWRPVTAIRNAAMTGGSSPVTVSNWLPYDPVTPAHPDYVSFHAAAGGAAAHVLKTVFMANDIAFDQSSQTANDTSKKRHFASFTDAAEENAISRVYIGYHFRLATTLGLDLGNKVGDATMAAKLRAL
ncbi:vanadium-dependent haloperoxidase [Derxia gummosa]|uniref:Vanadium-dependent haloperoxidase n=1 Tax=Derxia gummosa DSM 723 TaxID=1121388 RepID=A0A8B6XCW8_9BURK|nr:vanadium-dependent haloperoxidase [Derxia gummosa]